MDISVKNKESGTMKWFTYRNCNTTDANNESVPRVGGSRGQLTV